MKTSVLTPAANNRVISCFARALNIFIDLAISNLGEENHSYCGAVILGLRGQHRHPALGVSPGWRCGYSLLDIKKGSKYETHHVGTHCLHNAGHVNKDFTGKKDNL